MALVLLDRDIQGFVFTFEGQETATTGYFYAVNIPLLYAHRRKNQGSGRPILSG